MDKMHLREQILLETGAVNIMGLCDTWIVKYLGTTCELVLMKNLVQLLEYRFRIMNEDAARNTSISRMEDIAPELFSIFVDDLLLQPLGNIVVLPFSVLYDNFLSLLRLIAHLDCNTLRPNGSIGNVGILVIDMLYTSGAGLSGFMRYMHPIDRQLTAHRARLEHRNHGFRYLVYGEMWGHGRWNSMDIATTRSLGHISVPVLLTQLTVDVC